jgi:hypothetical protein
MKVDTKIPQQAPICHIHPTKEPLTVTFAATNSVPLDKGFYMEDKVASLLSVVVDVYEEDPDEREWPAFFWIY